MVDLSRLTAVSAQANLISTPGLESVPCSHCGAPGVSDQRYCLECGARRGDARSRFLDEVRGPGVSAASEPVGVTAPSRSSNGFSRQGGGWTTVIAGVGVLLLAMGVGVLIGRSGGTGALSAAPAQVVTVDSGGGTGGTGVSGSTSPDSTGAAASGFSDSWPAGKNGYTVQLQTLSMSGTQAGEVTAAETAALGKGAKAVGALRSDDYRGLPSGLYVIYSGVYASAGEAGHALGALKRSFPAAKAIHVDGASGASSARGSATQGGAGAHGKGAAGGANPPAATPPSTSPSSGQSNEQKSRNMPNVVSTG